MKTTIKSNGLQSRLARKLGVARSTINGIFSGKHRATASMAAKLEEEFTKLGIPLNRWALLYDVRDNQSLADYLEEKARKES